jgi:hypothetical protein
MKLIDNLLTLCFRRRTGKTHAIINGIKNTNAIIIIKTLNERRYLLKEYPFLYHNQIVTINNLNALQGNFKPIIFDHSVIEYILIECNRELEIKDKTIISLNNKLKLCQSRYNLIKEKYIQERQVHHNTILKQSKDVEESASQLYTIKQTLFYKLGHFLSLI